MVSQQQRFLEKERGAKHDQIGQIDWIGCSIQDRRIHLVHGVCSIGHIPIGYDTQYKTGVASIC